MAKPTNYVSKKLKKKKNQNVYFNLGTYLTYQGSNSTEQKPLYLYILTQCWITNQSYIAIEEKKTSYSQKYVEGARDLSCEQAFLECSFFPWWAENFCIRYIVTASHDATNWQMILLIKYGQ